MQCDVNEMPAFGVMGLVMHKMMNRAKEMYQEFDLNWSQASILFTLHDHSSMSQKALASQFNMSPPAITSAIQKLERGGYIKRRPDESDQRVMRLELTEKGTSCIQAVRDVAEEIRELVFRGMTQEEIMLFRRLLIQINTNLE